MASLNNESVLTVMTEEDVQLVLKYHHILIYIQKKTGKSEESLQNSLHASE